MNYFYLLVLFAILFYVIERDKNVAEYTVLIFKAAKLNIQRFFLMIHYHPKNPIQDLIIRRRSWVIAKKLQEEIKNENQKDSL
jgi:hypothetical protein